MLDRKDSDNCVVCVLAHNEESNIERTIRAIYRATSDNSCFPVKIYANGCIDRTHEIVRKLQAEFSGLDLIILERASKTLAWNRAFRENHQSYLIFSDGDVVPAPGAISEILDNFRARPELMLASCEQWPVFTGAGLGQKIVGLLQIPLCQDFLAGGFYGLRRPAFQNLFHEMGIEGLPAGIVGEDAFLDSCVTRSNFLLIDKKALYQPPRWKEYFRYLGRLKWQNEQLQLISQKYPRYAEKRNASAEVGRYQTARRKVALSRSIRRLLLGVFTTCLRLAVHTACRRAIAREYSSLGPVVLEGSWVLSRATRSESVK